MQLKSKIKKFFFFLIEKWNMKMKKKQFVYTHHIINLKKKLQQKKKQKQTLLCKTDYYKLNMRKMAGIIFDFVSISLSPQCNCAKYLVANAIAL